MAHISVEGMDGVGKTTVCRMLSEKLGYKFVEKPLHYLFDDSAEEIREYVRIRDEVNKSDDRLFTSWFYALGSIYLYSLFKDKNIITDRHVLSNYAWSGTQENEDVFRLLLNKIGNPDLTVILYAGRDVIEKRIKTRNEQDDNLAIVGCSQRIYEKMIYFCNKYGIPFMVINTENVTAEEVVDKILDRIYGRA